MVLPFSTMSSIKGALQRLEKLSMLRRLTMHSARPNMSARGTSPRFVAWRSFFLFLARTSVCIVLTVERVVGRGGRALRTRNPRRFLVLPRVKTELPPLCACSAPTSPPHHPASASPMWV